MDEFFNFEDAAHPVDHLEHPAAAPYDLDLVLAELAQGEDHLAQVNSYVDALPQDNTVFDQMNFDFPGSAQDTAMMGPDDFTDFPRWIDGMDVPPSPASTALNDAFTARSFEKVPGRVPARRAWRCKDVQLDCRPQISDFSDR